MPLPFFFKKPPPQPAPANLQNLAFSVRQPYAELILRGKKQIEYRTVNTRIRGRVYIYASQTPGKKKDFARLGLQPGDLPTGVLVGTVEIVGCVRVAKKEFEWSSPILSGWRYR